MIEFAIKDYTAGTGQAALWLLDLGLGAAGYDPAVYGGDTNKALSDAEKLSKTPIVSRFFGTKANETEREGWDNFGKMSDITNREFSQMPEFNSLGIRLGEVGTSISNIELTPLERAKYQRMMADIVTPQMQELLEATAGMEPEERRKELMSQMVALKREAGQQFITQLGDERFVDDPEDYAVKLGMATYAEASDSLEAPIYTTADYDASLTKWLLDQKESKPGIYGKKVKAKIESDKLKDTTDLVSKVSPIKVNADVNKGDTYIEYYQQWQARKQYESNPIKLKDFDARFPDAKQGNITHANYVLLNQYHSLDGDKEAQRVFMEKHPELEQNPHEEYLKANPKENAMLAIFKKEKIITQAAYDEAQRLIKELDIPESALPKIGGAVFGIPVNEEMVPAYFSYKDTVGQYGASSPEAKLILAQDDKLLTFFEKDPIKESIPALEIQVRNRKTKDQYDALDTKQLKDKFKADNPNYSDDLLRIEAYNDTYEYNGVEPEKDIIEKFVEYSKAGKDQQKLLRYDNPKFDQWLQDVKGKTQLEPFSADALRIDVKNQDLNAQYDQLTSKLRRLNFELSHPEWVEDGYRTQAYEMQFNFDNRTANKKTVEAWVQYNLINPADTGRRQQFRLKNPEFDLWGQMVQGWKPLSTSSQDRRINQLAAVGRALR
jgi:hypothetical protein